MICPCIGFSIYQVHLFNSHVNNIICPCTVSHCFSSGIIKFIPANQYRRMKPLFTSICFRYFIIQIMVYHFIITCRTVAISEIIYLSPECGQTSGVIFGNIKCPHPWTDIDTPESRFDNFSFTHQRISWVIDNIGS